MPHTGSGVDNKVPEKASSNIWEGEFVSWNDAREAAEAIGGKGLGGDTWFRRITQQLEDYRREFRDHGVAMPPRPSSLPAVCAVAAPATIVDFGGSSGWCWDYLKNSLTNPDISSYVVIETAAVVEYMKRSALQRAPVLYQTADEPVSPTDLLYCNSVLQYGGSNEPFLSLVERSNPRVILLEDLVAKGQDDFFTIQMFRGSAMPYRFLGLEKLLRELKGAGYIESARCPYASPVNGIVEPIAMGNFPRARQLRYSLSIVLQRSAQG